MKKINLNKLAIDVSKEVGGRRNLSIAQIKEVIKCTFVILGERHRGSEILDAIERTYDKAE